jgi:putative oxidoreductase
MKSLTKLSQHGHWLLRGAIASVFIYHGLGKFQNLAPMANMMNMPIAMLFLVASAETVGGALVLLGGFLKDWTTRIGALILMPVMLGAIQIVHWGQWHFKATETHPMGGMQFPVTLLLVLLYLFVKGNSVNSSEATVTS